MRADLNQESTTPKRVEGKFQTRRGPGARQCSQYRWEQSFSRKEEKTGTEEKKVKEKAGKTRAHSDLSNLVKKSIQGKSESEQGKGYESEKMRKFRSSQKEVGSAEWVPRSTNRGEDDLCRQVGAHKQKDRRCHGSLTQNTGNKRPRGKKKADGRHRPVSQKKKNPESEQERGIVEYKEGSRVGLRSRGRSWKPKKRREENIYLWSCPRKE